MKRRSFVSGMAATAIWTGLRSADAALDAAESSVIKHYLAALQRRRYAEAFGLLSVAEQRYFDSAANFASIFTADDLALESFRILASRRAAPYGTAVLVRERVTFLDHAHQQTARATVTVPYGLVGTDPVRVKDPYHPWRAVAPRAFAATTHGVRASIRKVSFFTGRLEAVIAFANVGMASATVLPYGRSIAEDSHARVYHPLSTRLPGLTDRTLYAGLRLAPNAEYTGFISFLTPARFQPETLAFTFGPVLLDGSNAPFAITVAPYAMPLPSSA